ncbi:MAG: hypothetical protein RLY66_389 [Candidatus Parcubacteria bacterium]|jgi:hypothetical protein
MAETKEKAKEGKENKGALKKKLWIVGILAVIILFLSFLFTSPSVENTGAHVKGFVSCGVVTVDNTLSESIEVGPDEDIVQQKVTRGVEWEKFINGRLVRYYPVGKPWVDVIPDDQIGEIETVSYRVRGDQHVTMQIAYAKFPKGAKVPQEWYQAALATIGK